MTTGALPRSYLYVPGNAQDKLAKAFTRGADALILDLEDAVPMAEKHGARASVVAWLHDQPGGGDVQLWVRVNSGALLEPDVQALAGCPSLTGLVLAKVEDAAVVSTVVELLSAAGDTSTLLMPMVETASAVLDARDIARQPRVHQLQIGEIDLAGDVGITPGSDESELAGMRTLVVLASAAAGVQPPVGPVSRLTHDLRALRVSTERVRRQGFAGRACIHPAQVAVVHDVFTPSDKEVEEARGVIRLLRAAEAEGSGVVLDSSGRLVDSAVLASARKTLVLAERAAPT